MRRQSIRFRRSLSRRRTYLCRAGREEGSKAGGGFEEGDEHAATVEERELMWLLIDIKADFNKLYMISPDVYDCISRIKVD